MAGFTLATIGGQVKLRVPRMAFVWIEIFAAFNAQHEQRSPYQPCELNFGLGAEQMLQRSTQPLGNPLREFHDWLITPTITIP
jgi:hypothetical protein